LNKLLGDARCEVRRAGGGRFDRLADLFRRGVLKEIANRPGADGIDGGAGRDVINVKDGDGDDSVDGGSERDNCVGDTGDGKTNCP
jgi:hypothetical protein